MTDTKICTKCGESKPLDAFSRNRGKRDGRTNHCKTCANADRRRRYLLRKDQFQERSGTKSCVTCHEAKPFTAYGRNFNNCDGYEHRCKPCMNARILARRKQRKSVDSAYAAQFAAKRRRHRKRRERLLAQVKREPYTREEIFERDGWVCGICDEPIDAALVSPDPKSASVDHIVPISRGGDDTPANVQAAHMKCNYVKGEQVHQLRRRNRSAAW